MMDIRQLKQSKILVIGDACLDMYHFGTCTRLSPEAPVPIFQLLRREEKYGMSANVVDNLKGLGNKVDMIVNEQKIYKHRYIDERTMQHLLRVDEGDDKKINELTNERIDNIRLKKYDAVVISDYDKGFLTYEKIERLLERVYQEAPDLPVFIDTKKSNFSIFGNHSHCIIKINEHEYQNVDDDLLDREACELVVTLGKNGAWWMNENKYYQTNETSVFDVCGAGDTFLAGLVTAYLSSKQSMDESIIFANKCASFAVKKLGTYAIKKEDISGIM